MWEDFCQRIHQLAGTFMLYQTENTNPDRMKMSNRVLLKDLALFMHFLRFLVPIPQLLWFTPAGA